MNWKQKVFVVLIWSLDIKSLPPGFQREVTWHEVGKIQQRQLSVTCHSPQCSVYVTQLNVFQVTPVNFLIFTFLPLNSCPVLLRRHQAGDMKRRDSGRYRGSTTRTKFFLIGRRKNISSPSSGLVSVCLARFDLFAQLVFMIMLFACRVSWNSPGLSQLLYVLVVVAD